MSRTNCWLVQGLHAIVQFEIDDRSMGRRLVPAVKLPHLLAKGLILRDLAIAVTAVLP
jgi:hypothetical protein